MAKCNLSLAGPAFWTPVYAHAKPMPTTPPPAGFLGTWGAWGAGVESGSQELFHGRGPVGYTCCRPCGIGVAGTFPRKGVCRLRLLPSVWNRGRRNFSREGGWSVSLAFHPWKSTCDPDSTCRRPWKSTCDPYSTPTPKQSKSPRLRTGALELHGPALGRGDARMHLGR